MAKLFDLSFCDLNFIHIIILCARDTPDFKKGEMLITGTSKFQKELQDIPELSTVILSSESNMFWPTKSAQKLTSVMNAEIAAETQEIMHSISDHIVGGELFKQFFNLRAHHYGSTDELSLISNGLALFCENKTADTSFSCSVQFCVSHFTVTNVDQTKQIICSNE